MGSICLQSRSQQGDFVPLKTLEKCDERISVRLPDLFILFLSESPAVNPHYLTTKEPSEAWISKLCSFDKNMRQIISRTDFAYFVSIAVPEAGPRELRTCFDWGNWVFPFDDMFDNGSLKEDRVKSQEMIDRLLYRMQEGNELKPLADEFPLIQAINSVWDRIVQTSPKGVQRRYAKNMSDYAYGAVNQVEIRSLGQQPSVEEALALRRDSAGVSPLFSLVEYAHRLNIPDEVFECPSIKKIERIGIDFVVLQNDMLSYPKEEEEGVEHNLIAICRNSGMSAQASFDHIGGMLDSRYRDWYFALAELPSWGPQIDAQVQRYIHGVQNVVKANLHWSLTRGRYFGDAVDQVRKTMTIHVKQRDPDRKP